MPRERADRTLRPVHANRGLEAAYRRRMDRLIEDMHRSVMWFLRATYRHNESRIVAEDASPADELQRRMSELRRRWERRFNEMAERMAEHFSQSVERRSSHALMRALKDGGFAVEFQVTPAMRSIMSATVHENVALIRSIPQKHLTEVEGIVMRGVQSGRDLAQVTRDLEKQFGVTRRRAALIARDQNNKANAAFTRARQLEAGITEAIWVHSHGGREPRKTHVQAGRERARYNVAEGWYDPDPKVRRHIHPGELINCRCVSRPVVKGFS